MKTTEGNSARCFGVLWQHKDIIACLLCSHYFTMFCILGFSCFRFTGWEGAMGLGGGKVRCDDEFMRYTCLVWWDCCRTRIEDEDECR